MKSIIFITTFALFAISCSTAQKQVHEQHQIHHHGLSFAGVGSDRGK